MLQSSRFPRNSNHEVDNPQGNNNHCTFDNLEVSLSSMHQQVDKSVDGNGSVVEERNFRRDRWRYKHPIHPKASTCKAVQDTVGDHPYNHCNPASNLNRNPDHNNKAGHHKQEIKEWLVLPIAFVPFHTRNKECKSKDQAYSPQDSKEQRDSK